MAAAIGTDPEQLLPLIRDVWELVSHSTTRGKDIVVTRFEVPGGWIYKTETCYIAGTGYRDISVSTCFVPFPRQRE